MYRVSVNPTGTDVTLWGDLFAPVTSCVGFLRSPLADVAEALVSWRREIFGTAKAFSLAGGLDKNVAALEPLTDGGWTKELLVATKNPEWVALFEGRVPHGNQDSSVGNLSCELSVEGLVVDSIPTVLPVRLGSRQFEMYSPRAGNPLNSLRAVSLTHSGSRWEFEAFGEVQNFEDVSAYRRRRKRTDSHHRCWSIIVRRWDWLRSMAVSIAGRACSCGIGRDGCLVTVRRPLPRPSRRGTSCRSRPRFAGF